MSRHALTLRMLVLVPLVAAGVALTQATAACGTRAQECLAATGHGWVAPVAVLLVVLAAIGAGLLLVRARPPRATSFGADWALATAGVLISSAAVGGGSLSAVVLSALGGLLLAAVLRAADAAAGLRPQAPRLLLRTTAGGTRSLPFTAAAPSGTPDRPRGRGPPAS